MTSERDALGQRVQVADVSQFCAGLLRLGLPQGRALSLAFTLGNQQMMLCRSR